MGIPPKDDSWTPLTETGREWVRYLHALAQEKRRIASEQGEYRNAVAKRRRRTKLAKAQKRRA